MNSRAVQIGFFLLAGNVVLSGGCFSLAKQAYEEARGAQAEVLMATDIRSDLLARANGVEFPPATTTAGRVVPAGILRAYERSVNQAAAKLKAFYPGDPPILKVDSEVLYFQKKGLMSGALLLVRTKMECEGQIAVDAIVKVESNAYRAGGEDDLAQAYAEAVRKFLERQKSPAAGESTRTAPAAPAESRQPKARSEKPASQPTRPR